MVDVYFQVRGGCGVSEHVSLEAFPGILSGSWKCTNCMLQCVTWIILHCCSKLVCIHFGSWDNSREWTVALPEGESIQVCGLKIPI